MALDGLFLHKLALELSQQLKESRVEKIYQPSKEELVFVMRTREGAKKLYFNSQADGARVHLTEQEFINPASPPMLCMLLRKRFNSARLESVSQNGFERVLIFEFTALNDFGDRVWLKVVCEIMGRYSNIIFLEENGVIIDAVKRVGSNKSSVREVLPGLLYVAPPAQDKYDILQFDNSLVFERLKEHKNRMLSKALLLTIQGISPLRCMELVVASYGEDLPVYAIEDAFEALGEQLERLRESLIMPTKGCIVSQGEKLIAFSFTDILQFGSACQKQFFESLSEVPDHYYSRRMDTVKRTASGAQLLKKTASYRDKLVRKIALLKKELAACDDCEQYKIYGELINANLYALKENHSIYSVLNYYTNEMIDIPADRLLTPAQNAAKYYKEYRKKQNAKVYLKEQIEKAENELEYLESVEDMLGRATTPEEIAAIKYELITQGFLHSKLSKREKNPKQLKPYHFLTRGGFDVLVGRNNLMNDRLSFKESKGNDIWLHAKNFHGSHTILVSGGKEVPQEDIIEAAVIAAYYSKARESSNVPVDYTFVKFVKRQQNRIPGRVFYTDYQTVYVNPDKELIDRLKQ